MFICLITAETFWHLCITNIDSLAIIQCQGQGILPYTPDIACFRISVFKEFPYLYDGNLEYEASYLKSLVQPNALVLIAKSAQRIVGAATGLAFTDSLEKFQEPFRAAGEDIKLNFLFLLLPEFRKNRIGSIFFDGMEAFAKKQGFSHTMFCAVDRPEYHTYSPKTYHHLPSLYEKRNYKETGLRQKSPGTNGISMPKQQIPYPSGKRLYCSLTEKKPE